MFPSEYQGFAIALFNCSGAAAGTISTLVFGKLLDEEMTGDDEEDAEIRGYIFTGIVVFGYICCAPLFIISGKKYSNQLEKNTKQITSTVANQAKKQQKEVWLG